jgi:pimeloyl-ACP methyl ester carboxylesterase
VITGCGYGAEPDKRVQFAEEAEASAKRFEELTMAKAALAYASGPTRVQHMNRDPRGWKEFADQLAGHPTEGATLTLRTGRQDADHHGANLVMTGDEDWPCLEPSILMKKNIATAALVVMPNAGHNINLEDPAAFNAHVQELFLGPTPAPGQSVIRA